MTRLSTLCVLGAVALPGCAISPNQSYVSHVSSQGDVQTLGASVADFVALRLPAGSLLALAPTQSQGVDPIAPTLTTSLQQHGIVLAPSGQPTSPAAHSLRYLVTPLDNGDLVRITLDGSIQAARFFVHTSAGMLEPNGPLTVSSADFVQ